MAEHTLYTLLGNTLRGVMLDVQTGHARNKSLSPVLCFRLAAAANETLAAAQQIAAALLGGVTPVVLLENMMNAATIRSADERQEVSTEYEVTL